MRLLFINKSGALDFTPDLVDEIPPYAILSHVWGRDDEEVTFIDIADAKAEAKDKSGYQKLTFCLEQAKKDGLQHVWLDTCCIDKRNFTELSEAINMMFRWYQNANRCYVLLSDAHCDAVPPDEVDLQSCRWFTRGWTLQELLAPRYVAFFSSTGQLIGTRHDLAKSISLITGIETEALQGKPLHSFSIDRRFEWAQHRQTKKPEDAIYSLLGIFGVSMTLNYAEGKEKALRRLKQEIAEESSSAQNMFGRQRGHRLSKKDLVKRRREIVELLTFGAMETRRSTISQALEDTCKWLTDHPMYSAWRGLQSNQMREDFLWIKGHPGAGKSTLMKYIDYHIGSEIEGTNNLLLSFYFNARGDLLEKTITGMYRSLLVQLLRAVPSLGEVLDNVRFGRKELPEAEFYRNLPLPSLKELLLAVMVALADIHIYCLVDALDETNEEEVLDMVYFLQDISSVVSKRGVTMITCFASRHYPTLDIPTRLQLVIDHEQGHRDDIKRYIDKNLHLTDEMQANEVKADLSQKANGIFIWIVLVIGILNKEYRRGNVVAVQSRLQQLPGKMSDLLKDISSHGEIDRDDFLWCLQWLLYAQRPLELPEFYFAMLVAKDNLQLEDLRWDRTIVSQETMERAMLSHSKGLAELTNSDPPVVQFIHESVRDFLIYQGGLQFVSEHEDASTPSAGHELLKQSCHRALKCDALEHLDLDKIETWEIDTDSRQKRKAAVSDFPLLSYAAEHMLYHAEQAAKSIPQDVFCRTLDVEAWCNICIALGNQAWRARSRDSELSMRPSSGDATRHLLLVLVQLRHETLVQALLNVQPALLQSVDKDESTPLHFAVRTHNMPIVDLFLNAGADANARTIELVSPLHLCSPVAPDMIKKLLAANALVDSADSTGRTPLHVFSGLRSPVNLETLLVAKPSINLRDKEGWTALHYAIEIGGLANVQLLVEAGIDTAVTLFDLSPLQLAIQASRYNDVTVLINAGLDINAKHAAGETALHTAAKFVNSAIIKVLCEGGADVTIRNDKGLTAAESIRQKMTSPEVTRDKTLLLTYLDCITITEKWLPQSSATSTSEASIHKTVDHDLLTIAQAQQATAEEENNRLRTEMQSRVTGHAREIRLRREDPAFKDRPKIDMSMERAMSFDLADPDGAV